MGHGCGGLHACRSIATLMGGCLALLVSGCRITPPIVGLHPVYPPVKYGQESFWHSRGPRVVFARVDSIQPVLKWQAFPEARDRKADEQKLLQGMTGLRYDLRIWEQEVGSGSPTLIYEREGWPQTEHRVEKPLAGHSRYYWSVRARFELNGATRVTPWSFSILPASPTSWHYFQRIEEAGPPNYFAFETP